jgi:hypothetical protein
LRGDIEPQIISYDLSSGALPLPTLLIAAQHKIGNYIPCEDFLCPASLIAAQHENGPDRLSNKLQFNLVYHRDQQEKSLCIDRLEGRGEGVTTQQQAIVKDRIAKLEEKKNAIEN